MLRLLLQQLPAGTPSAPLKLDPNDPLAAVQGNWRAILNRMSVPGAAEQLMKFAPLAWTAQPCT